MLATMNSAGALSDARNILDGIPCSSFSMDFSGQFSAERVPVDGGRVLLPGLFSRAHARCLFLFLLLREFICPWYGYIAFMHFNGPECKQQRKRMSRSICDPGDLASACCMGVTANLHLIAQSRRGPCPERSSAAAHSVTTDSHTCLPPALLPPESLTCPSSERFPRTLSGSTMLLATEVSHNGAALGTHPSEHRCILLHVTRISTRALPSMDA
jgi:hypothetical protein